MSTNEIGVGGDEPAVPLLRASGAPHAAAPQAPLDLSLGHIGTTQGLADGLKPVRVVEDSFDWVSEEQIEAEVWAAFRAAVAYMKGTDWREHAGCIDVELLPGTLLQSDDGKPYVGRETFAEVLVFFFGLRIKALAKSCGLRDEQIDWRYVESHPEWARWIGGPVVLRSFPTKAAALKHIKASKMRGTR